jgi:hypothetical protein
VVVEPLDFESNRILVLAKPELTEFLSHLASGKVLYHTYFKHIFVSKLKIQKCERENYNPSLAVYPNCTKNRFSFLAVFSIRAF